jgi:ABC-type tungstate transport system permease subunit
MLVHAKNAEDKLVAEGYGVKRYPVIYNDFVIVGPKESSTTFSDKVTIEEVFEEIAKTKSNEQFQVERDIRKLLIHPSIKVKRASLKVLKILR